MSTLIRQPERVLTLTNARRDALLDFRRQYDGMMKSVRGRTRRPATGFTELPMSEVE
jgi:hypothetical protein